MPNGQAKPEVALFKFTSGRLMRRPCLPQTPTSIVRGRFNATHRPIPPEEAACKVFSIWTHFGGNLVSPKWMIEDERDIWVVKCAALLLRKRSVFEENGHLTTQMSQEQFRLRFGGPEGSPKRFQIKTLPTPTMSSPPERSEERGPCGSSPLPLGSTYRSTGRG